MADFVNTVDLLGDDAVIDSIVERTIEEFLDDTVTKIGKNAFASCQLLTTVDIPNVDGMLDAYAFTDCPVLRTFNASKASAINESTFDGCKSLEKLVLRSLELVMANWGVRNCYNLRIADFGKANRLSMGTFANCHSLVAVVLRRDTVADGPYMTIGDMYSTMQGCHHFHGTESEYNPDGLTDGYFYVPAALVEDYKVATNWCNFVDRFRAVEEYTVDGTVTGELDETKI